MMLIKFGDDTTSGKATVEAKFDSSNPAMKNFFGPVGNKVVHNQHGAYATGDGVYYMSYRMLDKDGAITYTHEMTHDSDQVSTLAAMVEEVVWDQSSSQKAYCKPLTNQVTQPLPLILS